MQESRQCSFYRGYSLLLGNREVEVVDINIAARFLRSKGEESVLGAHEEALPVETQTIALAYRRPLFTIVAKEEGGHISLTRTEVAVNAQEDLL